MPRFTRSGRAVPRRAMRWVGTTFNDSHATALTATAIVTREEFEELTSPTLTRIRGVWSGALNAAGSVDTQPVKVIAIGIIMLNEDAVAAGAIPDPLDPEDLDRPWLYVNAAKLTIGGQQLPMFNSSGVFVNLRSGYTHYENSRLRADIDVQAQRKATREEGCYLVFSQDLITGTDASVSYMGHFRALIKE